MTTPTILSEEFPELLLSGWNLLIYTLKVLILYHYTNVNKNLNIVKVKCKCSIRFCVFVFYHIRTHTHLHRENLIEYHEPAHTGFPLESCGNDNGVNVKERLRGGRNVTEIEIIEIFDPHKS